MTAVRPARSAPETCPWMTRYLDEIGRVPLLTAEEEVDLSRVIRARRSTASARAEAVQELVTRNLRLVTHIARTYRGRGLDLADLIQEGVLGLIRAAQLYDWRRGVRFGTYATLWIHQAIRRALECDAPAIRSPSGVLGLRRKLDRLREASGATDAAADEGLLRQLGMTPSQAQRAARRVAASRAAGRAPFTSEPVLRYLPAREAPDDGPDDLAASAAALVARMEASRERPERRMGHILRCRYLTPLGDRPTLRQLGRQLRLSRERVRQIEREGLERLRQHLSPQAALSP